MTLCRSMTFIVAVTVAQRLKFWWFPHSQNDSDDDDTNFPCLKQHKTVFEVRMEESENKRKFWKVTCHRRLECLSSNTFENEVTFNSFSSLTLFLFLEFCLSSKSIIIIARKICDAFVCNFLPPFLCVYILCKKILWFSIFFLCTLNLIPQSSLSRS